MSYQSPIELIMSNMNTHIQNASLEREMDIESTILKAIEKVGVNIDKDELIRALRYDRNQYQKGYDDRDAEIVRCKDCDKAEVLSDHVICCNLRNTECQSYPLDWFCAGGERKG